MVCSSVLFHLAPHAQQIAAPDLGDQDIAKLWGGNLLRVWGEVTKRATAGHAG